MKLMTKEIKNQIPGFRSTERIPVQDRVVYAKFFTPIGNWTWYALEYDSESREFFGLVSGHETEFGYFGLDELEGLRLMYGLSVERDLYFSPTKIGDIPELAEWLDSWGHTYE